MQINSVIAHQRVKFSPASFDVEIHVIDNLGGANIFATTVLAQCKKNNPDDGEFNAKAFFTEYTDSTGSHPLDDQQETTILFLNGVNSLTHVTGAANATVESLTTVWLLE